LSLIGARIVIICVNLQAGLTPAMALRIEKAFGPKMEHLMRMQLAYDLAQARKDEGSIAVRRHVAAEVAAAKGSKQFSYS
jgi:plasmid maintenance system antidote protein VapI